MDEVPDGLHQVRLPQAHAAVDEERVIGLRRAFGNSQRRCVGKAVTASDHEALKGIFGIQMGIVVDRRLRTVTPVVNLLLHLVPAQQDDLHRHAGVLAQPPLDQVFIFILDHGDHPVHLDRDEQRIVFQQAGDHVAVDPRAVRYKGHVLRQQSAGLVPE